MDNLKTINRLAEKFPLLAKGGKTGKIIIAKDWSKNSLGSMEFWPPELVTSLGIILYSPVPMFILWGPRLVFFYNDAYFYSSFYENKEVEILGLNASDAMPKIWNLIKSKFDRVFDSNDSLLNESFHDLISKEDHRFPQNISFSPIGNEKGQIIGVISSCIDINSYPANQVVSKNEFLTDEVRLNLAMQASELGIWELDLLNDEVTHSDRLPGILGLHNLKKLTANDIRKLVYPLDKKIIKEAFDEAIKSSNYHYEARMIKPDSSVIYIRVKGKVIYDENGKPIKLIGTTRDVTIERQNRKALERSERRLRRLILNAPIAIGILNGPNYIVEIMNDLASNLMGKTKEQMLNKPVLDSITELDPESTKALLDSVYSSGKPFSASEFPVRLNRFGKYEKVFINFEYHPLFNSKEEVYGIMVVGIDVTNQVVARQKIEESEGRFRLLADSMPQFVWSADEKGNINYFNRTVYDYSGLTEEQVRKRGWLEIVHPDERKQSIKQWKRAISTGKDFTIEHRFKRFDGQYRWQLSRAVPLHDEGGKIQQWIGTSTDIQDMKLQEQHKDFFISMASHELKTPITSMKGYVQILQSMYESSTDEFLKKSLDRTHIQIEKLISIIGDLLDVSKIRTGSLSFNKQNFELNSLILEVKEELAMIYPLHKIIFEPGLQIQVCADKERVSQVLINLISNAIKYSPQNGDILISSKMNHKNVMISVKDEGIGIDKNYQRKIFERFYRVEGKSEKTFPGFGIGLFIASEIIRRHRGTIGVESEPGKGSRFYFSLPLSKQS